MRWLRRSALGAVLLGGTAGQVESQAVMQLEGGGNSVTGGYGGSLNFWTRRTEGWIGAGYADGWRIGGYAKTIVGRDTVGAGSRFESLSLPTDLFGGAPYILTQGVDWQSRRGETKWMLLAGLSGVGVGAPFVNTVRAERPVVTGLMERRVAPDLTLHARAVGSARQSFFAGLRRRQPGSAHIGNATLGIGANKPYGALSASGSTHRFDYRATLVAFAPGFRRADVPLPRVSETYRENVVVTTRVNRYISVVAGRQHFRQEQFDSTPRMQVRIHQLAAHLRRFDWQVSGGVFDARTEAGSRRSGFGNVGRNFGSRFAASLSGYATEADSGRYFTSATVSTRQIISPRLSLLQLVSRTQGQTSVGLGGAFQAGFTGVSIDYQTVYVPLREPDPFVRTLALSVRLQLGRYSTNLASAVDPAGNVSYTASGSTFLYLGEFGTAGAPITMKFERYVVRGIVVDETGAPFEGAAIEVGDGFVVTNSRGEFMVRVPRPGEQTLRVVLEEFVVPGEFEVVTAPASVVAQTEELARPMTIVVRRKAAAPRVVPPAPAPAARPVNGSPVPPPPSAPAPTPAAPAAVGNASRGAAG